MSKKKRILVSAVLGALLAVAYMLVPMSLVEIERVKVRRAKEDLKRLETAILAFYEVHSRFPYEPLEELCTGKDGKPPVFLSKEQLIDPWVQRYFGNLGNPPAGGVIVAERLYCLSPPKQNWQFRLSDREGNYWHEVNSRMPFWRW